MDLGCREFVYWSVPAILLILYGLAVAVPGFRGGVMLLGALAIQNGVMAWAYRKEPSRYQRELDRLDQNSSKHDPLSGGCDHIGRGRATGRQSRPAVLPHRRTRPGGCPRRAAGAGD
jgi:hypothetical protein